MTLSVELYLTNKAESLFFFEVAKEIILKKIK